MVKVRLFVGGAVFVVLLSYLYVLLFYEPAMSTTKLPLCGMIKVLLLLLLLLLFYSLKKKIQLLN